MKIAILIAILAGACFAGEPRLVTFTSPILLTPKERKDHGHVVVQVISKSTTNRVVIETTNRLVTLHDMENLPDGHAFFVVRSVLKDGQESLNRATDIYIDRGSPEPPTVGSIDLTKDESEIVRTFDDLMLSRRQSRGLTNAPLPTTGRMSISRNPIVTIPPPMLNATNRAYREDLRRSE